jgi:hypothetical protein
MIVAIHQPNFFPWLGYFCKIARADIFVFLDAAQIIKTGGSWTNRVCLRIGGKQHWVSVPLVRGHGYQKINEVVINDSHPWRKKLLRSLEVNYVKSEHFVRVMSWLEPMILRDTNNLSEYNIRNIKEIAKHLSLECRFARQSEMSRAEVFEKRGSERLAAICQEVGGHIYLAGDGAEDYENTLTYQKAGIGLYRNNFQEIPYTHVGSSEFIPGLSVLDALFNVGLDKTREFLTTEQEEIVRIN